MHGMDLLRSKPGLMAKLSAHLGLTRAAVATWRRVPAERLPAVCAFTGFTPQQLRPDLYPEPAAHAAPAAKVA
jgi:DNA-binding transcriptional regulator YdaS (Cro superfamily)